MLKTIYTKDHKKMIEKLKLARILAKLDQETVAKRLNKSQSYISKMESGQRRMDLVQLKRIAEIYGVNIEHFVK